MSFQINALDPAPFAPLFTMSEAELVGRHARRVTADSAPGFPCRVSMADAAVGDRLILLHYEHMPAHSPFRASHAIYIREGAERARLAPGEVPEVLARRLLSVRAFDGDDMMVAAEVVEGTSLGPVLSDWLEDAGVAFVDIHYARPGCFAGRAVRP
ncbi:DUF1203 domain-containing protein [Pelagovum pacificum]|uniref:DUF1203 domain-containing protein n=1 Tax=Pelagovum pacificum TaxID=2588711 RepID=A0A5C5GFE2_9RHOB|nr:DUF1203 domain-containing protein [Pelagovum pacificum]QQA43417.1 DUF1203 domain-containing protein [Pelagovum pacificum]TNY33445.1 DUF1203 domain-containing protein [Pelagovum pacificum]